MGWLNQNKLNSTFRRILKSVRKSYFLWFWFLFPFIGAAVVYFLGYRGTQRKSEIQHYSEPIDIGYGKLWIVQDNRALKTDGGSYKINRKPFAFLVQFQHGQKLCLHAATSKIAYNTVKRKLPFIEPIGSPGTGIAELPNNEDVTLFLSESGMSCFRHETQFSSFDANSVYPPDDNSIRGRKTVEFIRNLDSTIQKESIEKFSGGDSLYLTLIAFKNNAASVELSKSVELYFKN